MRLVDADALMPNAEYKGKHDILTAYDIVVAPTVDAVPVVRCRECIHSGTYSGEEDNEMPLKCLSIRYGGVYPDWFCEHGEYREEDNT